MALTSRGLICFRALQLDGAYYDMEDLSMFKMGTDLANKKIEWPAFFP